MLCLERRLALIRPKKLREGHATFWFHQFIGRDFQRSYAAIFFFCSGAPWIESL